MSSCTPLTLSMRHCWAGHGGKSALTAPSCCCMMRGLPAEDFCCYSTAGPGFRNGALENTIFVRKTNIFDVQCPILEKSGNEIFSRLQISETSLQAGNSKLHAPLCWKQQQKALNFWEIRNVLGSITMKVMSPCFEVDLFVRWQCMFKMILRLYFKTDSLILMYKCCSDRRMCPDQDSFTGSLVF